MPLPGAIYDTIVSAVDLLAKMLEHPVIRCGIVGDLVELV
jgi:hypothetical protein